MTRAMRTARFLFANKTLRAPRRRTRLCYRLRARIMKSIKMLAIAIVAASALRLALTSKAWKCGLRVTALPSRTRRARICRTSCCCGIRASLVPLRTRINYSAYLICTAHARGCGGVTARLHSPEISLFAFCMPSPPRIAMPPPRSASGKYQHAVPQALSYRAAYLHKITCAAPRVGKSTSGAIHTRRGAAHNINAHTHALK